MSELAVPRSMRVRIGALMWAVHPGYLVVEVVVAAAAVAPYSFLDNTISDLGARTCTSIAYPYGAVPVCSPWHALLNGSFVVFGVLLVVGAVLIRRGLPRSAFLGRADSAVFGGLLERLALWPAYIWLPALAWAVARPRR